MLPKWHILFGAIFSMLVYFIFNINLFQVSLIFLASIFIDFDHYLFYVFRKKDFNLKRAYIWHKSLPKDHKPLMQIFHTIEFFIIIFLLSFIWIGFLFILIGLLLHSIIELIDMIYSKKFNGREFSLISYLVRDKKNYF